MPVLSPSSDYAVRIDRDELVEAVKEYIEAGRREHIKSLHWGPGPLPKGSGAQ